MSLTPEPVGPDPIRNRIMKHLKKRFECEVANVNGASFTWDEVSRLPLTKEQQQSGYAIGLYDTSERVRPDVQRDERRLSVAMEFHVKLAECDDAADFANRVLGEVQRIIGLDIYCTEENTGQKLSLNIEERGSELDITSSNPGVVAGVLIVEIKYRTRVNDPTTQC